MAKSASNTVRDVLRAQGIWDQEPTDEAVKVLAEALSDQWSLGYREAEYEANFNS